MMQEAIKNFPRQFEFEPEIKNLDNFRQKNKFVVVGMGGSHLAADLLKIWKPELNIVIRPDYGLPALSDLEDRLCVISSYSGNTEEALDAFSEARQRGLSVIAISIGGKLLELAKENGVPYIEMPNTHIEPRMGTGYSFKALLKAFGEEAALRDVSDLSLTLKPESLRGEGEILAQDIYNLVPVIYSSSRNYGIACNWKARLNETGKIPAFYNLFPELNHNEINGFDGFRETKKLCQNFCFIFIEDESDHRRIQKRMDVTRKMYEDRSLKVIVKPLSGKNIFEKIFKSLILADWVSYYTAENHGVRADGAPMVEELKKMMR